MEPWDDQDAADHTLAPQARTSADDDSYCSALYSAAWGLAGLAVFATLRLIFLLGRYQPPVAQVGVFAVIVVFALAGAAVCTVCCAVRAAELRIRRDR